MPIADELYAGDPAEFVARRDALVKQARADKDRALADALKALRRPTFGAWYVNVASRARLTSLVEFLKLGRQLRAAQSALDFKTVVALGPRRAELERRVLSDLTAHLAHLGITASPAGLEEVRSTLRASLSDADASAAVEAGRLDRPLAYGDLGSALGAAAESFGYSVVVDADNGLETPPGDDREPRGTETGPAEPVGAPVAEPVQVPMAEPVEALRNALDKTLRPAQGTTPASSPVDAPAKPPVAEPVEAPTAGPAQQRAQRALAKAEGRAAAARGVLAAAQFRRDELASALAEAEQDLLAAEDDAEAAEAEVELWLSRALR